MPLFRRRVKEREGLIMMLEYNLYKDWIEAEGLLFNATNAFADNPHDKDLYAEYQWHLGKVMTIRVVLQKRSWQKPNKKELEKFKKELV